MRRNRVRGTKREIGRRRIGLGAAVAAVLAFGLVVLGPSAVGAQAADDPADLMQGMEVFDAGCNSCHRTDGSGSASGRSLIDIAIEQPDRSVHIESVTNGIGRMPAYGDRLTEDEIDAAVTYLRLTFVSGDAGVDELPNTGGEVGMIAVGLGLIAIGASMVRMPSARRIAITSRR